MLFHLTWQFTDLSEEGQKRSLKVFQNWQPAAGAEFKGFFAFADCSGGVAIIEVDSAQTISRICAPFTAWMDFSATPIVPIEESALIAGEANAFRDSVP